MRRAAWWGAVLASILASVPASLTALAVSAKAQQQASEFIQGSNFQSGNWSGSAWSSGGSFAYCMIQTGYQNGITLYVAQWPNQSWRIAFQSAAWKLIVGQTGPAAIYIDGAGPWQLQSNSLTNNIISVEVPNSPDLYAKVRAGNVLTVQFTAATYTFNLTGTNDAVQAVQNCVNRYAAAAPPGRPPPTGPAPTDNIQTSRGPKIELPPNSQPAPPPVLTPPPVTPPVATPPAPPPAPIAPATAEQRAQALKTMTEIVGRPEMTGLRILTTEEIAQRNNTYFNESEAVFGDEAVIGTLRYVTAANNVPSLGVAEMLFTSDTQACADGKLQKNTWTDERGTAVVRAVTTCERSGMVTEARYIIVPRSDGSRYLFATLGVVQVGASAINRVRATDALMRQAINSVMKQ